MNRPPRRSYGYINNNAKEQGPLTPLNVILAILIFPFRVIVRILKVIFKNRRGVGRTLITGGLTLAVLGFILGVILVFWYGRDLPDPAKLTDRQFFQSTQLFDRTGEHLLYEFYADQNRTVVPLEHIPEQLKNAIIATEDTAFYEHRGIRPMSLLRAIFVGVFTNKRVTGASTLTQQLVKNALLTNERRISRKIKEAVLTIRLEQTFTKDQLFWHVSNRFRPRTNCNTCWVTKSTFNLFE